MRKLLLVFGAIYILAGICGLSFLPRMLSLYQQLNVEVPISSIIWMSLIIFFGILNWILYFTKNKSKNLQVIVITLGILGIFAYLGLSYYNQYRIGLMGQEIMYD